ncbi:unknown [Clostridium sp. CAG:306]|nr:unknown [Clostridium sp. CAG:306]
MYCIVNDEGGLEVYTDTNDICFNCKQLYKCPLIQALSKEYVILHYSNIEIQECGIYKH